MTGPVEGTAGLVALGAGAGFLLTAAALLTRTLRPMLETRRYIKDIHGSTDAALGNLHALSALEGTRDRTAALARALQGVGGEGR